MRHNRNPDFRFIRFEIPTANFATAKLSRKAIRKGIGIYTRQIRYYRDVCLGLLADGEGQDPELLLLLRKAVRHFDIGLAVAGENGVPLLRLCTLKDKCDDAVEILEPLKIRETDMISHLAESWEEITDASN